MKFSKLDLLTLLISLFLFSACNESNTLGLDLDPDDAIQGALVDTLTIKTQTVAEEVRPTYFGVGATNNPVRVPFGYLVDDTFGTSEASLALSVNLPSAGYSFGTNASIDSAVLVLSYAAQFYGDTTTSVYSIDVKQLTNNIAAENSFLSNKEWAAGNEIHGNFTGKIKPSTPVKITRIVSGVADTVATAPAAIRIKLDNDFAASNILNAGAPALLNNVTFNNAFKGLKVSINKASTTGKGGLMFFNFNKANSIIDENASIVVYYKKQNATTATSTDTVSVAFPISQSAGPVAATIKHNYTGTPVATQLADATNKQYEVTYLQPLAGLRNKISIPYLSKFAEDLKGKIVINKAELVVDLSNATDVPPYLPAQRLALYQLDIAGQRALIPDQNSSDYRYTPNYGTAFDLSKKRYTFIVTGLVQDLLDGKSQNNGLYLAPGPDAVAEYSIAPSMISANRSVIGSFPNETNKVKLNIYYTRIN
jgi:hypothetical protein